jgi:hypothetical protein
MDPVLMLGAWAGALIATAGASRLLVVGFTKLVRASLADEMKKVWLELREQDDWFHEQVRELREGLASISKELRPNGGASLRDTVDRLERMMMEQTDRRR